MKKDILSTKNYESENWRNDAACRDTDPDLFFPIGSTGPAIEQIADAKKVCRDCLVKLACLDYALNSKIDSGIWGGLTEVERRGILLSRLSSKPA